MSIGRWHGPLVRASDWAWRILVVLALAAILIWAGIAMSAIVVPALLAVVVIPVGRPLVERFAQRMPTSAAAALVLLLALAILVGTGWLMVASIAANWQALSDGLTDAVVYVTDWVSGRLNGLEPAQIAEIQENMTDLVGTISTVLIGGATRGVAVIGAFLVGFLFFVVTLYFGLRDWPQFRSAVVRMAEPDTRPKASLFLDRFDTVLRNYWRGQALIGLFDAVALALGLWLIGVPLIAPIAILTFVLSFIPYVGAVVAGALAVFVALGTGGGGDAAWTLLLVLFVFNTGENLMRPWLIGDSIKMPTFTVFIVGTVGVLVAGALGALLAIPLVALAGEARGIFMGSDDEAANVGGET